MQRGSRILRMLLYTVVGGFLIFTLEHILMGDSSITPAVWKMANSPAPAANPSIVPKSGGEQPMQFKNVLHDQPVVPVRPANPGNVVVPVNQGNVVVPAPPVNPVNVVVPVNSGNVLVPVRAVNPVNAVPVRAVNPVNVVPVRAVNPGNVGVPVQPMNPGNVGVPVRPVNPGNVVVPVQPMNHGNVVVPVNSGNVVVPVQPIPGNIVLPANPTNNQDQNVNEMRKLHHAYQDLVDKGLIPRPQHGSLLNALLQSPQNVGAPFQSTHDGTGRIGDYQKAPLEQPSINQLGPAVQQYNPHDVQSGGEGGRVANGLETKVLRWNGKGWSQLHQFCAGNFGFKRTILKSPEGNAMIYIHDLNVDRFVSGSLKKHGLWDLGDVTTMIQNLKADPEMGLIDIGSHVGTFSIVAAIMGRKVVAVDPLVSNVLRFCKSVQDNNFTDKITIFYTAISNGYKKVTFKTDIGNIGGTRIVDAHPDVNITNVYDPNYINTVPLDDLLTHIPFKRAFVKMDVEEHEYHVITSGVRFFRELDITGILMEWMWQKSGPNGKNLRDYLVNLGYVPLSPNGATNLSLERYQTWPNDVLWKKI